MTMQLQSNQTEFESMNSIWIQTEEHKKFFCIQHKPELKIWVKDEELTIEQFKEYIKNK